MSAARPARRVGQAIELNEPQYGRRWLLTEGPAELLFTENETNTRRLYGYESVARYVKDGINDYLVHGSGRGQSGAHRDQGRGALSLHGRAGETVTVRLRLTDTIASAKRWARSSRAHSITSSRAQAGSG